MARRKPRYAAEQGDGKVLGRALIDTCVWIDLATHPREQAFLWILELAVRDNTIELILPQTVVDEWNDKRAATLRAGAQRMTAALRDVREVVQQVGSKNDKRLLVQRIRDFSQKVPLVGNTPQSAVVRIDKLFAASKVIQVSDAVKLGAAQRAIDRRAPFHRPKNSMNDAILVEVYADAVAAPDARGKRFLFVSKNTNDFSDQDARKPHPHIAQLFSRMKSRYYISTRDLLYAIDPTEMDEMQFNAGDWDEPRVLSEIQEAEQDLFYKISYNRKAYVLEQVRLGHIRVVEKRPDKYSPDVIDRPSIKLMRQSMRRAVQERGVSVKGPWTDFEWGMVNGKLSALRWVLGSEWDFLDT